MTENRDRRPKKRKRTAGDVFRIIALLIAIGVFVYSGFRLLTIYLEYKAGTDEYSSLEGFANISGSTGGESEGSDVRVETNDQGETERYMESPVDFAGLKAINKDVIGWINVEALDISYPMVRGTDNDYYLHRTFKKEDNFAGSIFMDYLNNPNLKDQNTIIYGHNMKNGSMFGTLKQFREEEVFEKSHYFWIYTPKMNYKYEIFSCHEVGAVSNTYQISFAKDKDFQDYLDEAVEHSVVKSTAKVTAKDHIVTLSTCTGNEATRFVVQGVLVDSIKVK